MGWTYRLICFLVFIAPIKILANESCSPHSQKLFCRLIRCVEGTQWKNDSVPDPFVLIKEDDYYLYNTLLIPMGHNAVPFVFHKITENKISTFQFDKSLKLANQCQPKKAFAHLNLEAQCRSSLPWGVGCLFHSKASIKLQPYKVNYWDGKKVNFICHQWSDGKNESLTLTEKPKAYSELPKLIAPLLKMRMRQLARAVRSIRKSVDPHRVIASIKHGDSAKELGDCRYFLDGNTLNLLSEAIKKAYPRL